MSASGNSATAITSPQRPGTRRLPGSSAVTSHLGHPPTASRDSCCHRHPG
jgi:hypothetical protein